MSHIGPPTGTAAARAGVVCESLTAPRLSHDHSFPWATPVVMAPTSRPIPVSRGTPRRAEGGLGEGYPPMKINRIALAALVPAAVAGITISGLAGVQAATDSPSGIADRAVAVQPIAAQKAKSAMSEQHAANVRAAHRAAEARRAAKARAAQAARAAAGTSQQAAPSSQSISAGMSSFERCVAWRESGNNPTASSAGLFGILPATWASLGFPGTAGQASVAMQKAAFDKLYAQLGTSPWAPYDGC